MEHSKTILKGIAQELENHGFCPKLRFEDNIDDGYIVVFSQTEYYIGNIILIDGKVSCSNHNRSNDDVVCSISLSDPLCFKQIVEYFG